MLQVCRMVLAEQVHPRCSPHSPHAHAEQQSIIAVYGLYVRDKDTEGPHLKKTQNKTKQNLTLFSTSPNNAWYAVETMKFRAWYHKILLKLDHPVVSNVHSNRN